MRGVADYASNLPDTHPFYKKCPGLHARSLSYLGVKHRRWQWITAVGLFVVLCNVILIFWLSSIRRPVVYVDTILKTGQLYQVGILSRPPLGKIQSRAMLSSHGIKLSSHHGGMAAGKSNR